jgi:Patatin-like phospholipase
MNLTKTVFDVDHVLNGVIPIGDDQCRFDYQKLEHAIKAIVKKKLDDDDAIMADTPDNIPTFVVATKGLHADGPPTLFRSYQCQGHSASKCTIWEAGRATSAIPTFFKPIKINIPPLGATFVDGGLTYNNPAELALFEAQKIWTSAKRFCLVSIGTGRMRPVRVVDISSDSSNTSGVPWWILGVKSATKIPSGVTALKKIAQACVELTGNSEPVHQRLLQLATSPDPEKIYSYHRFNVARDLQDIGLEEWNKMEELAGHTTVYMEEREGELKRNKCVEDLMKPPAIECNCHMFNKVNLPSYQAAFCFSEILHGPIPT